MWHQQIDAHIKVLPDGSDRLLAIQLQTSAGPTTIINTYMPTEGTHTKTKYSDITDEVFEMHQKYGKQYILWVGDLNGDTMRNKSNNDKQLAHFMHENGLQISPLMPQCPTFHHFNGSSVSRIDLVIHPAHQPCIIKDIAIDSRNPVNLSTHDAIVVTMDVSAPVCKPKDKQTAGQSIPRRIKWHKVDIQKYKDITEERITTMVANSDPDMPVEVDIIRLNNILTRSAAECAPPPKRPGKPKRFKWSPLVKPLVETCKQEFHSWKEADRPTGPLRDNLTEAKRNLRRLQRQLNAQERDARHSQIMEASTHDQDLFHKLVRLQRGDGHNNVTVINFKTDPDNTKS